jgi:hypothetical protein
MDFCILLRADDKGASAHQEKEIRTKKERGKKWEKYRKRQYME